jgi:hypothetical protein
VIGTGTNDASVFTVVAGKVKTAAVRLGLQTDTQTEVSGPGIRAGSIVITSPPSGLQDGSTVLLPGQKPAAPPAGH